MYGEDISKFLQTKRNVWLYVTVAFGIRTRSLLLYALSYLLYDGAVYNEFCLKHVLNNHSL